MNIAVDTHSIFQEYKPPSSKDIPIDFRIELLKDAPNPVGVLGSKGKQDWIGLGCK